MAIIRCRHCDAPATWRGSKLGLPHPRDVKLGMQLSFVTYIEYACDRHKDRLAGQVLEALEVPEIGRGRMTFKKACALLGYDGPQRWMSRQTRKAVIKLARDLSDDGLTPIDPHTANLCRDQIEMFG